MHAVVELCLLTRQRAADGVVGRFLKLAEADRMVENVSLAVTPTPEVPCDDGVLGAMRFIIGPRGLCS